MLTSCFARGGGMNHEILWTPRKQTEGFRGESSQGMGEPGGGF